MIFVGCDLGSTTGKIVVLDENLSVLGSSIVRSSHGPIKTFEKAVEKTAESMGISAEELLTKFKNEGRVVTTGYGRSNLPGYTDEVSEISCHAKGASHLCPSVRTIIDIGGQDCKVISVGPQGKVLDFQMNDKCSAGTGRFFEVMSRVLDIDLTHLAEEALKSPARFLNSAASLPSRKSFRSPITAFRCRILPQASMNLSPDVFMEWPLRWVWKKMLR